MKPIPAGSCGDFMTREVILTGVSDQSAKNSSGSRILIFPDPMRLNTAAGMRKEKRSVESSRKLLMAAAASLFALGVAQVQARTLRAADVQPADYPTVKAMQSMADA